MCVELDTHARRSLPPILGGSDSEFVASPDTALLVTALRIEEGAIASSGPRVSRDAIARDAIASSGSSSRGAVTGFTSNSLYVPKTRSHSVVYGE